MSGIRSAVLLLVLGIAAAGTPARGRADDFYKGKTVIIVVGFPPGGGYDFYARALAHFIPDHIPGHPAVVVENQPGAGSLVAVRSIAVTQPKDGTVMVTFNGGLVTQSVVQPNVVNLDFRKYAWVGIASPVFSVCYGYGAKGVASWDELMHRKEFNIGGTAKGSGNYIDAAALRQVLHAPIKQILGFPGSADMRLALERGELDGDCGDLSSIPADWLRNNFAHLFVRFTKDKPPEMPDSARFVDDFATTPDQKDLLDVLDAANEVGRPFVMAGEVPADRLAILRRAFDETMKDPGFIAETQKAHGSVHPRTGEEAERLIGRMSTLSPSILAAAKKIYE